MRSNSTSVGTIEILVHYLESIKESRSAAASGKRGTARLERTWRVERVK